MTVSKLEIYITVDATLVYAVEAATISFAHKLGFSGDVVAALQTQVNQTFAAVVAQKVAKQAKNVKITCLYTPGNFEVTIGLQGEGRGRDGHIVIPIAQRHDSALYLESGEVAP